MSDVSPMASPSPELWSLLESHCNGAMTPEQWTQLNQLLRNDPGARQFYILHMDQHASLLWRFRDGLAPAPGQDDLQYSDRSPASPAPPIAIPYPLPALSGYFASGWPIAYLIAAVIFSLGLAIGALVHVSQPEQYVGPPAPVRVPDPESPIHNASRVVARVTGMADCIWEGSGGRVQGSDASNQKSEIRSHKSPIRLGDRLALHSGLLEITYDTGATVILQGPVVYEVESPSGGYLSVGKLTAKLEQKSEVRDQRSEPANQKSEITNQKSPDLCPLTSDLFTVHTPTAIVTDLGTEFGVQVDGHGKVEVRVFSGTVVAESIDSKGHAIANRTLSQGEAVRIETGQIAAISQAARGHRFVRSLPRPEPNVQFLGPLPYQSFENRVAMPNISPFSTAAGGVFGPLVGGKGRRHWTGPKGQYFYLEDFETGAFHAPGLSASEAGAHVTGPAEDPTWADSVDEDDGAIDGATNGAAANSLHSPVTGTSSMMTINFDAAVLARLPSHVGFVITDCRNDFNTIIEAFDASHRSLGKKKFYNSTFGITGTSLCGPGRAERARFFGIVCSEDQQPAGIASIVISQNMREWHNASAPTLAL